MASIHSDTYREMIDLLRITRLKNRLYQRDVAEKLGAYKSYISKVESYESKVDIIEYFRIAKIVGVSQEEILKHINKHLK